MHTCNLPPPPKPAVVRKHRPANPPACMLQAAPVVNVSPTPVTVRVPAVTQTVIVNVTPATSAPLVVRRAPHVYRPVRATSQKFNLFLFGGVSPTRYSISSTSCTDVTGPNPTCTANVKRKWVPDGGIGAQVKVSNTVSIGVMGSVQGGAYGILGLNF